MCPPPPPTHPPTHTHHHHHHHPPTHPPTHLPWSRPCLCGTTTSTLIASRCAPRRRCRWGRCGGCGSAGAAATAAAVAAAAAATAAVAAATTSSAPAHALPSPRQYPVPPPPCRLWARGKGGMIFGDLPPYEAFPIGGTNSVRGYGEGAQMGGQAALPPGAVGCGSHPLRIALHHRIPQRVSITRGPLPPRPSQHQRNRRRGHRAQLRGGQRRAAGAPVLPGGGDAVWGLGQRPGQRGQHPWRPCGVARQARWAARAGWGGVGWERRRRGRERRERRERRHPEISAPAFTGTRRGRGGKPGVSGGRGVGGVDGAVQAGAPGVRRTAPAGKEGSPHAVEHAAALRCQPLIAPAPPNALSTLRCLPPPSSPLRRQRVWLRGGRAHRHPHRPAAP